MTMGALIVDIQYYPVNGTQVIKEATVLSLTSDTYRHFVFQNVTDWDALSEKDRKTARYICEELGGIHFNCGVDVLQTFVDGIPKESILIVNGHVKKKMLSSLFPHNRIVDLKVPFFVLSSSKKCSFPSYHTQCSLTNCFKVKNYL